MVSFRSASSTPILLATFALADESRDRWPLDLAAAGMVGATAIAAAVPWGYPAAALIDFAQLCNRLGFLFACDLHCLITPPLDLLRANPTAVVRDADGQPVLTAAGQLQADPLHGVLRDLARNWLLELAQALHTTQLPAGTFIGFLSDASDVIVQELRRWQHSDAWPGQLYHALPILGGADGWPFAQPMLRLAQAQATATNQRALAMLAHLAGADLHVAQLPTGAEGMHIAWADAPGIGLHVRHSANASYLSVDRELAEAYSGVLTYRNAVSELLHLHVNIGPTRHGVVLLRDEEVVGAAFDGDASEGVWLVRAMRSSVVFNGGSGAIIPCGNGILLLAEQSGRFQIRRSTAWETIHAYRLFTNGTLVVVSCQVEATHLTVPFVAIDAQGATDLYALIPAQEALPDPFRSRLVILLSARAEMLLITHIPRLEAIARQLQERAMNLHTITEYITAWEAQLDASAQARMHLRQQVAKLRATRLLAGDSPATDEELRIEQVLAIL